MKLIRCMFLIMVLFICGCPNTHTPAPVDKNKIKNIIEDVKIGDGDYAIVKIGECEYLKYRSWGFPGYTHKGDCNNIFHKDNQK